MRKLNLYILFILMTFFLLLSGCQTSDDYRKERVQKADEAFKKMKEREMPKNTILTLPECVNIALKNNLDMKVYELKAAVNKEQKTAEMLGMLPDLTVNDNMSKRNNNPESVAVNSQTGQKTDIAFYSQQQYQNTVNVDLAFSVIDFGLAYFKSVQAQDKLLITEEETRRAAQNLILDVTSAYFTVATAQYEMEKMEILIDQCDITDKDIEEIKKSKSMPLFSALYEQEQLLELKRDLRDYRRYYDNAWIQLKSLMGYHPISEVKVDSSMIGKIPNVLLPDIDVLESIALIERPELYQLDMQKHVTVVEARKTILMMFPNVQAFEDFTGSSNIYLINRTWWEIGMRASYNLLKLPQRIAQYQALDTQADQVDAQALALSVGILAQVRIAYADLAEVRERYLLQERIWKVYNEHLMEAEKKFKVSGGISDIEVKRVRMAEGKAELERSVELMKYYTSYYRVLNSIGVQTLDKEKLEELKIRITEATKDVAEDENKKIAGFEKNINQLKSKASEILTEKDRIQKVITQTVRDIDTLEQARASLNDEKKKEPAKNDTNKDEDEKRYNDKVLAIDNQIEILSSEKALNEKQLSGIEKELKTLNTEISEAEKKSYESKNIIDSTEKNLKKYDDFILTIENSQNSKVPAPVLPQTSHTGEDNLNTQMQLQTPDNTVYEESYAPKNSQDLHIQTQEQAGNNSIGTDEFKNTGTGSLNNEMIWDTDESLINRQEMNP